MTLAGDENNFLAKYMMHLISSVRYQRDIIFTGGFIEKCLKKVL